MSHNIKSENLINLNSLPLINKNLKLLKFYQFFLNYLNIKISNDEVIYLVK